MSKTLRDVIPIGHIYIKESVLKKGNIFGLTRNKSAWAQNLSLPHKATYTFFSGCSYQFMRYTSGMMETARTMHKVGFGMDKSIGVSKIFDKLNINFTTALGNIMAIGKEDPFTSVLTSAVNVLRKLGIDVGYLHENEPCCGSPLYYSGFMDEYAENAQKNYKVLKSLGIKKIIGFVPACTASLRDGYQKFIDGYDLEVKHFIEIVAEKLKETNLKPKLKEKMIVTYHDPCQLSRYLGIVKETREIMANIKYFELREPELNKTGEWSTCCGGGGLEITHPDLCERLGVNRVKELLATGAHVIVTSCASCMMQLINGANNLKADVKVLDLAQILNEAL